MNRDKQIEEMIDIICPDYKANKCSLCGDYRTCFVGYEMKMLYASGYRKASDVAREISQDIIEPLWNAYKNSTCQETVLLIALICETINNQLKKKYTEEGK